MKETKFIEILVRSCLIDRRKHCSTIELWQQKNQLVNIDRPLTTDQFARIIHELGLEQKVIIPITWRQKNITNQEAYWLINQIIQD